MTTSPSRSDWLMFLALTIIWGSAYAMIAVALRGFPPEAVVTGRLVIAALLLNVILRQKGVRLPSLAQGRSWALFVAMGLTGSVLPFLAISHAELAVSSSLAGLFLACTPILVAAGTHVLFPADRLNLWGVVGVGVGFAGMVLMAGADTFTELLNGEVGPRLLLLAAAACYAASTLLARGSSVHISPLAFATGFVTAGAVMSLVPLVFADWSVVTWRVDAVLGVIALGVFPSALAQVGYIQLVRSAGANFLALTNYTIPVWAALIGFVALGETIGVRTWIAFAVIVLGIWLARQGRVRTPARTGPR